MPGFVVELTHVVIREPRRPQATKKVILLPIVAPLVEPKKFGTVLYNNTAGEHREFVPFFLESSVKPLS